MLFRSATESQAEGKSLKSPPDQAAVGPGDQETEAEASPLPSSDVENDSYTRSESETSTTEVVRDPTTTRTESCDARVETVSPLVTIAFVETVSPLPVSRVLQFGTLQSSDIEAYLAMTVTGKNAFEPSGWVLEEDKRESTQERETARCWQRRRGQRTQQPRSSRRP